MGVNTANPFDVPAVLLEYLDNLIKNVKKIPSESRDELYLMQNYRLQ
ncbi:hypothetical protein GWK48_11210 [Metallosphaera tengchongensis]|uniref:Uncharacterized protein n=1 Tax=Metallosphaera tengchongensis TaxID=1532350 RepID=A0A6N0NXD5_9CREN|nr:hypothetical protein [Metallosphaera tengchongensis]QKR00875.1 hypothetical protein GWK48_11210 [Metallosphaera tengchongensis]